MSTEVHRYSLESTRSLTLECWPSSKATGAGCSKSLTGGCAKSRPGAPWVFLTLAVLRC